MEKEKMIKLFPACFPDEIQQTIRDIGYEEEINVYRVCRWGKVDKQAFLSTYEEYIKGLITIRDGIDEKDVKNYSTSTFENWRDIKRFYKLIHRPNRSPDAIIIQLKTVPNYGLVKRSKEMEERKTSHIHWWIYADAEPHRSEYKEVPIE